MDSDLDDIICTVLSLEEDYPRFAQPLRNTGTPRSPREMLNVPSVMDIVQPPKISSGLEQTLFYLGYHEKNGCVKVKNPNIKEQATEIKLDTERGENLTNNKNLCDSKRNTSDMEKNEAINYPQNNVSPPRVLSSVGCQKKTIFTLEQTIFLQKQFDVNPYPDFVARCQLAQMTGIPEPRIQVWYQNRRARHLQKASKTMKRKFSPTEEICSI